MERPPTDGTLRKKIRARSRNPAPRKSIRRSSFQQKPAKEEPSKEPVINEIPENLTITCLDMKRRKFMDMKRWFCISRPQLSKSCGISSLVSCWNYLYSTLGSGRLEPISQEKAITILGMKPPFENIEFGSFTGNQTLISWFKKLNAHFGVSGSAYIFFKMCGKHKTSNSPEEALEELISGLQDDRVAFIYHCFNHYFCPIGFDLTPNNSSDAYRITSDVTPWIAIGETSRKYSPIQFRLWSDIVLDISTGNPKYFNIRKPELGIQDRVDPIYTRGKKVGNNLHCILKLVKS